MLLRHVRSNLVAYLALFVALGGTSYAALRIGSKNIRNRSIRAVDVKKNSLTGTEVAESKLKAVPKAKSATRALDATTLQGRAPAAFLGASGKAKDADKLDGLDAAQLQRPGLVQSKRVSDGASPQPIFTWPGVGSITTDGDPTDVSADVLLRASSSLEYVYRNGSASFARGATASGGSSQLGASGDLLFQALVARTDGSRTWLITCARANIGTADPISCQATRSRVD